MYAIKASISKSPQQTAEIIRVVYCSAHKAIRALFDRWHWEGKLSLVNTAVNTRKRLVLQRFLVPPRGRDLISEIVLNAIEVRNQLRTYSNRFPRIELPLNRRVWQPCLIGFS